MAPPGRSPTASSPISWTFPRVVTISGTSYRDSCASQVTAGIGGGLYGVDQPTKRQQMAVFLLKSKYGICYTPPPCTTPVFPDVPCSSVFAPWINQLVAEGITERLRRTSNYCPNNPVNRQQMAVFLLKTEEGGNYVPQACTSQDFGDVPCSGAGSPPGSTSSCVATSPPAAAAATTARSTPTPEARWPCS